MSQFALVDPIYAQSQKLPRIHGVKFGSRPFGSSESFPGVTWGYGCPLDFVEDSAAAISVEAAVSLAEERCDRVLLRIEALDAHRVVGDRCHEDDVVVLGHGALQLHDVAAVNVALGGKTLRGVSGSQRLKGVRAAGHACFAHGPRYISAARACVELAALRVACLVVVGGRCPTLQAGEDDSHEGHGFLPGITGCFHQVGRVVLDDLVQAAAGEGSVLVAPLAVVLVLRAILIGAEGHVGNGEGGSAALACGLVGETQKAYGGNAQLLRDGLPHIDSRLAFPAM